MLLLSKMRVAILKRHGLTVFQGAKNHTTMYYYSPGYYESAMKNVELPLFFGFSPKLSYILLNYRFFSCLDLPVEI